MKKPSLRIGFRLSLRLWPLLAALWVFPLIFFTPFGLLISRSAGRALGSVPDGFLPPAGDVPLLVSQSLVPILPAIIIVLIGSILLSWAWTILWHAGLCGWLIWEGEDTTRLSRILGHGLLRWIAYFRLSLFSLLSFVLLLGATGVAFYHPIRHAMDNLREGRAFVLLVTALVLMALLKIILWAATMRGAWELAFPHRSSSVMAFFRGLRGALTQPVATLLPVAFFGVLITAFIFLPILLAMAHPELREGWKAVFLPVASGLVASFLQLWIFASMVPLSGIPLPLTRMDPEAGKTGEPEPDPEPLPSS